MVMIELVCEWDSLKFEKVGTSSNLCRIDMTQSTKRELPNWSIGQIKFP